MGLWAANAFRANSRPWALEGWGKNQTLCDRAHLYGLALARLVADGLAVRIIDSRGRSSGLALLAFDTFRSCQRRYYGIPGNVAPLAHRSISTEASLRKIGQWPWCGRCSMTSRARLGRQNGARGDRLWGHHMAGARGGPPSTS